MWAIDKLIPSDDTHHSLLKNQAEHLSVHLPDNPIDVLINELGGPSCVSEVKSTTHSHPKIVFRDVLTTFLIIAVQLSGRKHQVHINSNGDWKQVCKASNRDELAAFQSGKKVVAIITKSASTGYSLHSDTRARNQRQRLHIIVELPWGADACCQQFGESCFSTVQNDKHSTCWQIMPFPVFEQDELTEVAKLSLQRTPSWTRASPVSIASCLRWHNA